MPAKRTVKSWPRARSSESAPLRERKVVVVTGASAGIGREAARVFAGEGARVVAAARRVDRLQELCAEIEAAGGECLVVVTDVGEPAQVYALRDAAIARFGRIDVWINNAGYGLLGSVEQTTPDEMTRMWEVNYMGAFHGCLAALTVMRAQGSGHILNVSSMIARFPLPLSAAYTVTKCAVYGLSEALASELDGSGIHVTTLMVSLTLTEFGDAQVKKLETPPVGLGPAASARSVAERIAACVRRPRRTVYFIPFPPLVLALFDLFPFVWPWMARRYLAMRTGGK